MLYRTLILISSLTLLLFSNGRTQSAALLNLAENVSSENLQTHIDSLCYAGGYFSRITYTPGNYYASEYIARYFESLPGITSVQRDTFEIGTSDAPYNDYPVINIIATLNNNIQSDTFIVLGAHYDASGSREKDWSYNWESIQAQGADDNASGVAAVMEIARILSDPANDFKNRRMIKFIAFAAEEYHPVNPSVHHAGSLWDAHNTSKQNLNLHAAIVLDMIAYNPAYNYVEVISNTDSRWLADMAQNSIDLYTDSLYSNDQPVQVSFSDHQSYWDYGYPAILFMENDRPWNNDYPYYLENPNYHSEADTIGTLRPQLLQKVTRAALATTARLSDPATTTAIAGNTDPFPYSPRISAYPNPFNASTTIIFTLDESEYLTISVYDILGKKVAALSSNILYQAGENSIQWHAESFSSGIYHCLIEGRDYRAFTKITLLR